jgi:YVTN family beta-propeller protein
MADLRRFAIVTRLGAQAAPAIAFWLGALAPMASTASEPGLVLERTINLGMVKGRIDHLAVDLGRKRLFVAELGNDSVAVVDLETGQVWRRIEGLREPQGVGYSPAADLVAVSNAGDGSVRLFKGADLAPAGAINLGDDADNIRPDGAERMVVGYGNGGLASIDASTARKVADIRLPAHPEGFQIDPGRDRIYVNLPFDHQIAVIDRSSGKQIASWGLWLAVGNFPMSLDDAGDRLFVGYRWPASIAAIDTRTGNVLSRVATCADADDIFYDGQRKRLYASCGDGQIAILDAASALSEISRIATRTGARTSLFVPALDRLLTAVPMSGGQPAEIRVFAPR